VPVSTQTKSALSSLKAVTTRVELAKLLGYTPAGLSAILYHIPAANRYVTFQIPKKSGGLRDISAPVPALKLLQKRTAELLYKCVEENRAIFPHKTQCQFGYHKSKTIFDNARMHKGHRFVLNLDLSDFFGAINFGRVRGFFAKDSTFALNIDVATVLAQIACWNNSLPQGSPCSPIISNLVSSILDRRFVNFCKTHQCTYSRYVDDITISTNRKEFPLEVGVFDPANGLWTLSKEVEKIVAKAGFAVNPAKTRMQVRQSRQSVTGLTVNRVVNVRRDYAMRARAAVHRLSRTGEYDLWPSREKREGGEPAEHENRLERLEGVLQFINDVRERSDRRPEKEKKAHSSSFRKTYYDFLYLKYFVVRSRPLVICEGKTDNVYIRSAMKALNSLYPELGVWKDGVFQPAVDFFRYSPKTLKLMGLGGGCGDMAKLIRSYRRDWARLAKVPVTQPVIMVTDNDGRRKRYFQSRQGRRKRSDSHQ
jgi:hypothetical protein